MTSQVDEAVDGFSALKLHPTLMRTLVELGYEEPTPIQREAIPPLLDGHDVLGQAATGTGKTAAFALPILQRLASQEDRSGSPPISALVLVPTRELAMQVAQAIHSYGKALGVTVLPIYGGQPVPQQLRALRRGVDVVVATPGRALDHLRRHTMDISAVHTVVLDEADEMLDMGFAEDLEAILAATPEEHQTALFSATIPPRIRDIAARHLHDPVQVKIARESVAPGESARVREVAYVVARQHKAAALGRVLDMEAPASAIIFCRTRTEVDSLTDTLNSRGYRSEALHGGLSQEQRDRVMRRFRDGSVELLVATDVAARGLDIEHLSHVINFDVPSSPDAYVHRIGRTGRAGREGVALTLAEPREYRLLRNIEQLTRRKIPREAVPTVVDLRARRLELTRSALHEALMGGDLDSYRIVAESLGDEFDIMDIAAAAVKVAHQAASPDAAALEEIPTVARFDERQDRAGNGKRAARGDKESRAVRKRATARAQNRGGNDDSADADVIRLYIGLGRKAGVRPGDLVGAIANEAGVDARTIGAIDVADKFSLVEVPERRAESIIAALRGATIRGKRVMVRRDRAV